MSGSGPNIGRIQWVDLTVRDAPAVRDFYRAVAGWEAVEVDMGDYADFAMVPPGSDEPVAGVCHARGANEKLPPQWLVYIVVADLDACLAACVAHGGAVLVPPPPAGEGRFAVIRDPAGAIAALYQG